MDFVLGGLTGRQNSSPAAQFAALCVQLLQAPGQHFHVGEAGKIELLPCQKLLVVCLGLLRFVTPGMLPR